MLMPGKVKFITKDYPLERQCNAFIQQDLHSGACEAAVAVRLAREKGKGEVMEEWLYSNQPAMNPETVKKAAETVGGISAKDFDARFNAMLELVKADVADRSGNLRFRLTARDVYQVAGPVNLNRLAALYDLADRPDLKYPPFTPGRPLEGRDLFVVHAVHPASREE